MGEGVSGADTTCVNRLQEPLPAVLAQQTGIFVGKEHESGRIAGSEQ